MKSHRSFHAKLVCGSEAEADIGAMFNDRSNGRIPDQQPLAHKWYIGLSNLVEGKKQWSFHFIFRNGIRWHFNFRFGNATGGKIRESKMWNRALLIIRTLKMTVLPVCVKPFATTRPWRLLLFISWRRRRWQFSCYFFSVSCSLNRCRRSFFLATFFFRRLKSWNCWSFWCPSG